MAEQTWISLVGGRQEISAYQRSLGFVTPAEALGALAAGLCRSRTWRNLPPAKLVLRHGSSPALAAFGSFSSAHHPVLAGCISNLQHSLAHLLWLDWAAVRAACEHLGDRLREHLGDDLPTTRFEAIPRGGLIVLGILAQVLDLTPQQLSTEPSREGIPQVIVDDCLLSGARFLEVLERPLTHRLVFAHLASPVEARERIVAQEDRVEACLAAIDLEVSQASDHRPESYDWALRCGRQRRAWLGLTEHVCFPWNEPDRPVWDPVAGRSLPGWKILPPGLCLKGSRNREAVDLQVIHEPTGAVSLPPGVMFWDDGDSVAVARLPKGGSIRLQGTAASFWRALLGAGSLEEAVSRLRGEYDVDRETCRQDLEGCLTALGHQGFLRPASGEPG